MNNGLVNHPSSSRHRNYLAVIVSTALLSISIYIWSDLFFFSKNVYLPAWTAILPSPIDVPRYIALVCLLPAVFIPSNLQGSAMALISAILISPLLAFIAFAINTTITDSYFWSNAIFNYAWIIGLNCLLPALGLFAVRALSALMVRRRKD